MRGKQLVLILAALLLVVVLAACGAGAGEDSSGAAQEPEQKEQAKQETPDEQVAPDQGTEKKSDETAAAPEDKTLKLTVPKMERVENADIPSGKGTSKRLFRENTAVHLRGTNFPWEEEGNVYIAGHRLGYPGTDSYLAFNDIESLQNGDEILLEDANGTKYTYEVFNTLVVEPTNLSVIEPVEGKNIVSLQSCTLPDYSDRIIVQGELKSKKA